MTDIEFTYVQQPPKKYTFEQPRVKEWLEAKCDGKVLNLFAGKTRLNVNETRVDSSNEFHPDYHMEAFFFVEYCIEKNIYFDTIILDPPYSLRKSMEKYKGKTCSGFNMIINELPKILNDNGRVISFGYHSTVMGKKRGFVKKALLLIGHGGAHHDTIGVVEIMKNEGQKNKNKCR